MSLTWSQSASDYSISGTAPATLTKDTGTNWTNYCYTADTFGDFTAESIVASNNNIAVGVTDPTQLQSGDKDETSIRYGFYRKGGTPNEWRVVINGVGLSATDTSGTTAKITFDGTDVKFYVDTVEIYSHTATVTTGLYGYASVYNESEDVTITLTATPTPTPSDQVLLPPPVAWI